MTRTLASMVALLVGGAVGLIATPILAHIYQGVRCDDEVRYRAIAFFVALVFGTTVISTPVGQVIDDEGTIDLFVYGWALPLLLGGFLIWLRFTGFVMEREPC